MLFKQITGIYGSVTIPAVGLNIGTMGSWTLTRREETPPGFGEWDLRAVFSYINEFAWKAEGYNKEIKVVLGHPKKGKQYRLELTDGRTVLDGRSLLIEGVHLRHGS
jgi:hypothetical protein